jgi:hypothetical protein
MPQVLDVRPLRVAGQRTDLLSKPYAGFLHETRAAGRRSLSLITKQGQLVLGPLMDPEYGFIDSDGLVLLGKDPSTGLPQEWQVVSAWLLDSIPREEPLF